MTYILGFAGSNSSTSINYSLVKFTAGLIDVLPVKLMDMAQCPFPMYSEDHEREKGFSNALREIKGDIQEANGLIISVNEHNGAPSAYFKNLMDWLSRLDRKFIEGKKILLMATSGGKRGAMGSLGSAEEMLRRFGAEVTSTFSLPLYYDHFNDAEGIMDENLSQEHERAIKTFLGAVAPENKS
jgi:NAD(P)H-dependent FMN reductase